MSGRIERLIELGAHARAQILGGGRVHKLERRVRIRYRLERPMQEPIRLCSRKMTHIESA